MGRIDCEGALAVYRGEVPKHVANPDVLTHPKLIEKLARYRSAYTASQESR
jgi:hypothetical protein